MSAFGVKADIAFAGTSSVAENFGDGWEVWPRALGCRGMGNARGLLQTGAVGDELPVATLIANQNHCIAGDAPSAYSFAFSSAIRRASVCRFVSSDSSGNSLQKRSMLRCATMVSSATLAFIVR